MSVVCRVIPCLDVAAGRVVKGVNFENLRDMGDPVELARLYFAQGADELTFLDVTATVDERATTYEMVQRTAEQVFIPLTVGGGVRADDDVARFEYLKKSARNFGSILLGIETPSRANFEVLTARLDAAGFVYRDITDDEVVAGVLI